MLRSSFSSFQRLGHTKQISTVTVSAVSHASVLSRLLTRHRPATSQNTRSKSDLVMIFKKNIWGQWLEKYRSNIVALSWRNWIWQKLSVVWLKAPESASKWTGTEASDGNKTKNNSSLCYITSFISLSILLKTIIPCQIVYYLPGGYTQLQDLSDVQDDLSDVFRTTIIKIKGEAIKTWYW